jgi:predicted nucleic acid-binding protein
MRTEANRAALKEAASRLQAVLAAEGISEEEILKDFKQWRGASANDTAHYSPDLCFDDVRKYIPHVSARRRIDPLPGLAVLEEVSNMVESVDQSLYEEYETIARERVTPRDPDDWPVVAVASLLDSPSGQRTKISLVFASASPLGQLTTLNCT